MDIRVNIYPFPADRHLKRLYSFYNMPRDWWSSACVQRKHKQTQKVETNVVMDTLGTPDIQDAFLVNREGRVVVTLEQLNKMSEQAKEAYLNRGECWVVYKHRDVAWDMRSFAMKKKIELDPEFREPPTPYEEVCTDYKPFYVQWKEKYGICIDKKVVTYPELLKHANKGTRD